MKTTNSPESSRSSSPTSVSSALSVDSSSTKLKTIQIGEVTIPTAYQYKQVWGEKHVVQIQINNQLIPIKVSSLTKRLGWSHEEIKELAGEHNTLSEKALQFAFKTVESLPIFAQEHLKNISKLAFSHFSKEKKILVVLENSIIVLDPKTLTTEGLFQKGSGEGSTVFSKNHSNTILKTYSLAKLSDMRILSTHEPNADNQNSAIQEMRKKDAKAIGKAFLLETTIRKDDPLFQGGNAPSLEELSHISNLAENSVLEPLDKAPLYITTSRHATGDFRQLVGQIKSEEQYPATIFQLQSDLINDYARIHQTNVAHLDSKWANYLYYNTKDGLTARASDFGGSALINPTDTSTLLPIEIGTDIMFADGYTIGNEIALYIEKAKLINTLIEKLDKTDAELSKIESEKQECLEILQKIDIFQLGVAFYQMACKSDSSFPYDFDTTKQSALVMNNPKHFLKSNTKNELGTFYENQDKVTTILRMLSFDAKDRPTAQEVAKVFAAK